MLWKGPGVLGLIERLLGLQGGARVLPSHPLLKSEHLGPALA